MHRRYSRPTARSISFAEDIGRHNALDKMIGARFLAGETPLSDHILLVSGRASFGWCRRPDGGIPILAAVGAPSSLAVELSRGIRNDARGLCSRRPFQHLLRRGANQNREEATGFLCRAHETKNARNSIRFRLLPRRSAALALPV